MVDRDGAPERGRPPLGALVGRRIRGGRQPLRQGASVATGGTLTHRPRGFRRAGGGVEFRQRQDHMDALATPRAVSLAAVGACSPQAVRRSVPRTGHSSHARSTLGSPSRGARPSRLQQDLGRATPCLARPAPFEAGPEGATGGDVHPHRHGMRPRHPPRLGLGRDYGPSQPVPGGARHLGSPLVEVPCGASPAAARGPHLVGRGDAGRRARVRAVCRLALVVGATAGEG